MKTKEAAGAEFNIQSPHKLGRVSRAELEGLDNDRFVDPLADFASPHTEGKVDMHELRRWRLERVQVEMAKRDIGGLLLTNPVNIRYATGLAVMTAWTSVNLARYVFVPVEGEPVVFEYGKALFRALDVWRDSRIARTWQFRFAQDKATDHALEWAQDIKQLLVKAAKDGPGQRLGIDCLDFFGFEALKQREVQLCDADEVMQAARLTKHRFELELIKQSLVVAESALFDLEQAIRPGISENEMLGVFYKTMLSMGGEHCSTRLLTSGEKTNPWFFEAGTRRVRPSDLIAIDTDMVGPEGYLCDISRTFICGNKANSYQRDAYKVAREFIEGVFELCTPGRSLRELCIGAPTYPEKYQARSYSCMIHGIGMDDEPPFLPFPHALKALGESVIPDDVLKPDMVLSIEFYAGDSEHRDGVKLEDQVLITENGPVWLSRYPFDQVLS